MLTKKQKELFVYLNNYISSNDISPSFEEMKNAVNLKSKSGIHRLITSLEQRGYIKRLKHKARAMEITKDLPNNNVKSRRKPSPAMINEAFNKYFISKKGSFLIGDKESDIISAKKARIEGFLFEGGDLFDMIQKILKKNLI